MENPPQICSFTIIQNSNKYSVDIHSQPTSTSLHKCNFINISIHSKYLIFLHIADNPAATFIRAFYATVK